MKSLFRVFRKKATPEVVEVVEAAPAPTPTRRQKLKALAGRAADAAGRGACATGRGLRTAGIATGNTVGNLASDANTAMTTYRCARLARTLRRNEALAAAAREELS